MEQNNINRIKDKAECLFNDAIKRMIKWKLMSIGMLMPDDRLFLEDLSSLNIAVC